MSSITDQKEFKNLDFQIWHIWENRRKQWRDEIYIIGDDKALQIIRTSLQGLLDIFAKYGKGMRKYVCNPPKDFDHRLYGRQYDIRLEWLDSLIVRLRPEAMDNELYTIENFVVTVNVNPNTLRIFIEKLDSVLTSTHKYGHGLDAVCGLRFSPDWLGVE